MHRHPDAAAGWPLKPFPRAVQALTVVVLACATAASITTLLWPGSFPDPTPSSLPNRVLAEARGWSAATLLVAVPLALGALWASRRGAPRAQLVLLGVLANFVYTYLELAVSPPFTALYLVYVVAFACAISALVIGVSSMNVSRLPALFGDRFPRRTIAACSILAAAFLAVAWLRAIAQKTLAGAFGWPLGEDAVGHVVHALDLGLQVPLALATGILLLRRRSGGWLLAAIMWVNAACMGAGLLGMVLCSTADAGTSLGTALPFALFWLLASALAVILLRSGAPNTPITQKAPT